MDVLSFLKEALSSFQRVGAFLPAQKLLVNAVVEALPSRNSMTIVQLGAVEGSTTRAIMHKMDGLEYRLKAFELNEMLLDANRRALGRPACRPAAPMQRERIELPQQDAFAFAQALTQRGVARVYAVLSLLPLSHCSPARRQSLLQSIITMLREEGIFVQYRHTPRGLRELKRCFPDVQRRLVFNVLPAWVYTCRKAGRASTPLKLSACERLGDGQPEGRRRWM